jgi:opacity protein-like surface antigen
MLITLKNSAATILLLFCTCYQNVLASNWEWGSDFGLAAAWNDNPALSVRQTSTFRMVAIYNGEFSRLTPNSTLNFRPRVTRDYYPDKQFKDLQSTDFFLPGSYTLGRQRTNWNLGYNLSRQSVLSDESTLQDDGDFSQLSADDTVYRASLAPGMLWTLSLKDQINIGLTASVTDYDLEFTRRADAKGLGITGSYSRVLTTRQSIGVSASSTEFESENKTFLPTFPPTDPATAFLARIDNDSNSESFTFDYKFQISPTSLLKLNFGLQKTGTDNSVINLETGLPIDSGLGNTSFESTKYNVEYQKNTERGKFNIQLARRVTPATNGQPQDRYEIRFIGETKLSQRLAGKWRFLASEQQNIILAETEGTLNRKNRFATAELGLSWAFTRKWSIRGNYRYRYRDRDQGINSDETTTANSNAISVSVNYKWKKIQK